MCRRTQHAPLIAFFLDPFGMSMTIAMLLYPFFVKENIFHLWIVLFFHLVLVIVLILTARGTPLRALLVPVLIIVLSGCSWMRYTCVFASQRLEWGLPEKQVTRVKGNALSDSSVSTNGNQVITISLLQAQNRWEDQAKASGYLLVIGNTPSLVLAGSLVSCEGSLVQMEDGSWAFIASEVIQIPQKERAAQMFLSVRGKVVSWAIGRFGRLSDEERTLASLLALGLADAPDSSVRQMAVESGCAHILALSGMHLGCICALLRVVLGKRRSKTASLVVAGIYLFVAGLRPSLVRAALMLLVRTRYSELRPTQALSLAFLLQLWFFPATVGTVAFALSYSTLAGILLCSAPLAHLFERFLFRSLAGIWGATFAAITCSAPLVIKVFGKWYPIGCLASPILTPIAMLLLPTALLWMFIPIPLLEKAIEHMTESFVGIIRWASSWSASHTMYSDSTSLYVLIVLLLTFVALCGYGDYVERKRRRKDYELGFSLRFAKCDSDAAEG